MKRDSNWRMIVLGFLSVLISTAAASALSTDDEALRKEALRLNDVVGDEPIAERLAELNGVPEHAKRLVAEALKMSQEKEPPLNYNAAYILGNVAEKLKPPEVDAARTFYRICIDKAMQLKSGLKAARGYGDLAQLFLNNERYEEAEKVCKEFLEIPDREIAPYRIFILPSYVLSFVYQDKKDEAYKQLKIYEQIVEQTNNEDAQNTLRYTMSNLYLELGDIDKTTEHMQILLKKKPDDATYNNDLGYIWADHDRNIDEAEKMIRKALDQQPQSSAYLDSMGWVYYKQKKYTEAKEYLLKAVQSKDGEHAEIYDHLGDAHMALGEKAEAITAWKKALELSSTTFRDIQRKKKIEKKLMDNPSD